MFDGSLHTITGTKSLPPEANPSPQLRCPRTGLFDSGVERLFELRALQRDMPGLDYIYCSEAARLPREKRKPKTIVQCVLQASHPLTEPGVDTVVIACHTPSSIGLGIAQQTYPETLVKGAVKAGAQVAMEVIRVRNIVFSRTADGFKRFAHVGELLLNNIIPLSSLQRVRLDNQ